MGSNLYEENNFKPCLTKQLLNLLKLWCECGISQTISCFKALMTHYIDDVERNTQFCIRLPDEQLI